MDGMHFEHSLRGSYRVRRVASLPQSGSKMDVGSRGYLVRLWVPDHRWARGCFWPNLQFWFWKQSWCTGRKKLFCVYRSADSCHLLFGGRIHFLDTLRHTRCSYISDGCRKISLKVDQLSKRAIAWFRQLSCRKRIVTMRSNMERQFYRT